MLITLSRRALTRPTMRRVLRLLPLPQAVYRSLHFRDVVTLSAGPGADFRMHHFGYQVENDLYWAGYGRGWEATSLRLWALLAKRADVILDIGANTGVYALAAQAVNPAARIFAFEPVPRIAQRLAANAALNGASIAVVIAGASDQTGHATIFEPDAEHAYSASLTREMLGAAPQMLESKVPVTRIDAFAVAHGLRRVDLVKIDAERHEPEVLAGFGDRLARDRPSLLVEVLDRAMGERLSPLLSGPGYLSFRVDERMGIVPDDILGRHPGNYLLCRPDVADGLGIREGRRHADLAND
ncbi:FkbM family methyltransferase [Aureimonas glaciei]|uniref:Methyltransferase FkbM domain-containing protein n=1 Tax=Aureimonas glaciei TaxID=1776957 RepID=A0A916Y5S9_9HYPH|nr:FkbM family methyltransferase [Aureimonas glaciei]GGD31773.1 hypothetical protein GCM10011335_38560 [Aureimonas glaciei]